MTDQEEIIQALGVTSAFDAAQEAQRRTEFLATYLRKAGLETYVLGISGGVDSLAAAMLAQRAVRGLRETGYDATFIAVRLPYGVQADETDAQRAIDTIGADRLLRIDIKPASDAMLRSIRESGQDFGEAAREDFLLGNIKARQRMIAQYARCGSQPRSGHRNRSCGGSPDGFLHQAWRWRRRHSSARRAEQTSGESRLPLIWEPLLALVQKVPTADLETLVPLRPDEDAYGVTYEQIDDFLEGKAIEEVARQRILETYRGSAHKRASAVSPTDAS